MSAPTTPGAAVLAPGELAAASSLLSSRWSRDNLVTSHPARLYDGRVLERFSTDSLEYLIEDVVQQRGELTVKSARMGVFTWDLACESRDGELVLQVPLALDEPGQRGRAKRDVPGQNVENARYFSARGLTRFAVDPVDLLTLTGGVPAALFRALPEHRPLVFGTGSIQVLLPDGWVAALGSRATADVLAEMIAALVYHYEPHVAGGTAVADVFVNDGDFAARRRADGSLELRLTAIRRREPGIGPSLLLAYLLQMMAYEDFSVDGGLTGLPTLVSNPSVTFEGVVRGLRYRARDLRMSEDDARREAERWIGDFGRSLEGRSYRPWVERFLAGRLPLSFGDDPREMWWRLFPQQTRQALLELRGRVEPGSGAQESARNLKSFLERLSREIGRVPEELAGVVRLNELGGEAMLSLLADAGVEPELRADVAAELFARWPHRSLDQLLANVPGARGFRRFKSRLSFGRLLAPGEQGSLKALGAAPKDPPTRPLANRELFGALELAPSRYAAAVRTFPTFEAYMDQALHDPAWGYYGHRVVIGRGGHFDTHPEEFSPDYGAWVARWAFATWRDLVRHGDLTELERFPLIEFGAGNGRLARDVLDAIDRLAADASEPMRESYARLASVVEYRIYETSEALREKQSALLGDRALVRPGDAREPGATLRRDFPAKVRGFVITNEVPDAFGVHKVVLTAEGHAFAALVVPRVEATLASTLGAELARRIAEADDAVRARFDFWAQPGDRYLDTATFSVVMEALAQLPPEAREAGLAACWFEEAYVPVSALPALAAFVRAGASQYATALAAEPSGVVQYLNVHADGFMRGIASSLAAGMVVTVDYGDTTWGLVQGARRGDFPFRVYGEWKDYVPRSNDPYFLPGTQDLTADVNFTDLARAGEAAGLRLIHFGPERDLLGDALPAAVRQAGEGDPFAKFLGHPGFKILVLGTRAENPFAASLLTPLALTRREQDVPKARRPEIPVIEKNLNVLEDATDRSGEQ